MNHFLRNKSALDPAFAKLCIAVSRTWACGMAEQQIGKWIHKKLEESWSAHKVTHLLDADVLAGLDAHIDELDYTTLVRLLITALHLTPNTASVLLPEYMHILNKARDLAVHFKSIGKGQDASAISSDGSTVTKDWFWVENIAAILQEILSEGGVPYDLDRTLPEFHFPDKVKTWLLPRESSYLQPDALATKLGKSPQHFASYKSLKPVSKPRMTSQTTTPSLQPRLRPASGAKPKLGFIVNKHTFKAKNVLSSTPATDSNRSKVKMMTMEDMERAHAAMPPKSKRQGNAVAAARKLQREAEKKELKLKKELDKQAEMELKRKRKAEESEARKRSRAQTLAPEEMANTLMTPMNPLGQHAPLQGHGGPEQMYQPSHMEFMPQHYGQYPGYPMHPSQMGGQMMMPQDNQGQLPAGGSTLPNPQMMQFFQSHQQPSQQQYQMDHQSAYQLDQQPQHGYQVDPHQQQPAYQLDPQHSYHQQPAFALEHQPYPMQSQQQGQSQMSATYQADLHYQAPTPLAPEPANQLSDIAQKQLDEIMKDSNVVTDADKDMILGFVLGNDSKAILIL